MRFRAAALSVGIVLAAMAASVPAGAVDVPAGSKNFITPGSVPNYFSNESGPFQGNRPSPGASPSYAAPAVRGGATVVARSTGGRHYSVRAARGRGHYRLAQRRGGHRRVAYVSARGGRSYAARSVRSSSRAAVTRGRSAPASARRVASRNGR